MSTDTKQAKKLFRTNQKMTKFNNILCLSFELLSLK